MRHFRDHAAHRGGVFKRGPSADPVQTKTDKRRALRCGTPDWTLDLFHDDPGDGACRHGLFPYASLAASISPPWRRAWRADTLRLRRAATARGESCRCRASKGARTRLWGFDDA